MRYTFPSSDPAGSHQSRTHALSALLQPRRAGRWLTADGWFEIRRSGAGDWHVSLTGQGKREREALAIRARMQREPAASRHDAYLLLWLAAYPLAPTSTTSAAALLIT